MVRRDAAATSAPSTPTSRRALLRRSLAASAALSVPASLAAPVPAPALALTGRPNARWGVQVGDVTSSSGLVWVRSDRPARMMVETSATESFERARRWRGPLLGPDTDLTGRTSLAGLPAGEQVHYRVTLTDPEDPRRAGEPVYGTFRTAPDRRRTGLRFVWSGDVAGQGWGINPERGGFTIFEEMRRLDPDFFLHSGDTVYADGPLQRVVDLPEGGVWRNLVTEEKSKVAETLSEYRGNFRYNLLDEHLRRFNSQVPIIAQWDDHEVVNNWYPGELLDDPRYTERRVDVLAARARRAFAEYFPVRSLPPTDPEGRVYRVVRHGPLLDVFVLDLRTYRDANSPGREPQERQGVLGARQLSWLKRELVRSQAMWKVIACDMPLGLVVPDGDEDYEAVAQGDPGRPLGRELQFAELLRHVKHRGVTGTVWLTADVHYTCAQHYDPSRAAFSDFEPFWEFVTGPLHAGGFPAVELDGTFGPSQPFVKAPTEANVPPSQGGQFYGQVDIDGQSGELTVRLREQGGEVLFRKVLQPGRVGQ